MIEENKSNHYVLNIKTLSKKKKKKVRPIEEAMVDEWAVNHEDSKGKTSSVDEWGEETKDELWLDLIINTNLFI